MENITESPVANTNPEVPVKRPRGRPRRGEGKYPTGRDLHRLKKLRALLDCATVKEAYMKTHPNAGEATAAKHSANMITPEIFEELKELMGLNVTVKADKDLLEKVLFMVVSRWMQKQEKTGDMIAAIRELTKLVPEFKDKIQVEDITTASEEELDRKLRGFGYDPNLVTSN
jgi:hypothetical protein